MAHPSPGIAPAAFYNLDKCPIRANLSQLCNKWSLLILTHLSFGTHRFSELLGAIPDISQRMLTQNLRMLEAMNMISRTVTPSIPPRVDYALTPLGKSFLPPLVAMMKWSATSRAKLEEKPQEDSALPNPRPQKNPHSKVRALYA